MKRLDLGQGLTILANVGVIAGILLLAYELNQNRETTQSQTRSAISEMLISIISLQIADPEIAAIQTRAISGEPLTTEEWFRFELLQDAFWRYRENVHFQYSNGMYSEQEYLALRSVWIQDLETEPFREIYCNRRARSPGAFTAEMDSLMQLPCE